MCQVNFQVERWVLDRERERLTATKWLSPRTVKAFKAAGLMDPDRKQELGGDRDNGMGLGLVPALNKFRVRSGFTGGGVSEYGPSRAHLRMVFSEVGIGGGRSVGRRASGSGMPSLDGLMESPTFTASSGSHDRHMTMPMSIRSASASPFRFFG